MSAFVHHTLEDVRAGRSTWRVTVALSVPSFAIAFFTALIEFAH